MEALSVPKHEDTILKALSNVPMATAKQLAMLNNSLNPYKKASATLRQLEDQKLVQWEYHRRQKLWKLSKKGRLQQGATVTKLTNLDHALDVITFYFSERPKFWLYEPVINFKHLGQELYWNPDAIFTMNRKLYVLEVQRTPIGSKKWEGKWNIYNIYFNHGYFKDAPFQKWHSKPEPILPQFLVVSDQQAETVKQGFKVSGRELMVVKHGEL